MISRMLLPIRAAVLLAALALCLPASAQRSIARDVNVALARWGASATAESTYGPGYQAINALDGRWQRRETDKWNSVASEGPHWLVVDLGRDQYVHRIVIRHEGAYGDGGDYNTRDFRVQRGDSAEGPWHDLVAPVVGNTADVTTHTFTITRMRYVRLFITKGARDSNQYARIFELEAYSPIDSLNAPLMSVTSRPRFRTRDGKREQELIVQAVFPGTQPVGRNVSLKVGDDAPVALGPWPQTGVVSAWIPAIEQPVNTDLSLIYINSAGQTVTARSRGAFTPTQAADFAFPQPFKSGAVYLFASSHQDIAWMDTPDRCIAQRDLQVITPALERMRVDKDFRFTMEDTLSLMEYLQRHPDRKPEIQALTREGRFSWGATYNQPYEGLESGESLVRQFYYGRRWIQTNLPGCDSHTAWSPDVPGRVMQMPQMMAKAGVSNLIISRCDPGYYRWLSPDGSGVLMFSPGHYTNAFERLEGDVVTAGRNIASDLNQWMPYYTDHKLPPAFGYLISTDSSGPKDFSALRRDWPTGDIDAAPRLISATGEQFLDAITAAKPNLPTIVGERPDVWLYIHGPTHHNTVSVLREGARLLPAAETFACAQAMVTGSWHDYPAKQLAQAWMRQIYPDHGWGGYYGEITDEVFRNKVASARDTARNLLNRSLTAIASRVKTPSGGDKPLVVFNALSWVRTDPVTVEVAFKPGAARGFSLMDSAMRPTVYQPLRLSRYRDGSLKSVRILFVARDVPSLGYKTWLVRPSAKAISPVSVGHRAVAQYDNARYHVQFSSGGIKRLYDKQLKQEVFRTDKFAGGELFTMQSVGNGAGEFAQVQQPTMEQYDQTGSYTNTWYEVERGPVRTVFQMDMPKSDAKLRHCSLHQRIIVYSQLARIDFETDLMDWDGTPYREFRQAFPINATSDKVAYAGPMGVVQVGKSEISGAAGERYTQPCKEVHPREVQSWLAASGDQLGATLSSCVAVCDYIDPTTNPVSYPVLQPILLASRRSCHGLGNWYLQAGNHHYRFVLTPHAAGWQNGWRSGEQSESPLMALYNTAPATSRMLPMAQSFCTVSRDNVMVTALKRCEDDNSVVVRCVDMVGKDSSAQIRLRNPAVTAKRTNLLEQGGEALVVHNGSVTVSVPHHSIETVKMALTGSKP